MDKIASIASITPEDRELSRLIKSGDLTREDFLEAAAERGLPGAQLWDFYTQQIDAAPNGKGTSVEQPTLIPPAQPPEPSSPRQPELELVRREQTDDKNRLNQVKDIFTQRLLLPDNGLVVEVLLAAVIANRLAGDPFWLFLVNPPSGVKTELISTLSAAPDIYPLSDLTPQTFASGFKTENADEEPSLLLRLKKTGKSTLAMKDFTTVLSMREHKKAEILAQLREIYDGSYTKPFGTGKTVTWQGKLGLIAGVTPVIDRQSAVNQVLGERFVFFRIRSADRVAVAEMALASQGKEKEMRADLQAAVTNFLKEISLRFLEIPDALGTRIARLADFGTTARSSAIYNHQGAADYLPEPEGPARLTKQLAIFGKALALIRGKPEVGESEYAVLYRLVTDTIHAHKFTLLSLLREKGPQSPKQLIEMSKLPRATVYRFLEELLYYRFIEKDPSNNWQLSEEWKATWDEIFPSVES